MYFCFLWVSHHICFFRLLLDVIVWYVRQGIYDINCIIIELLLCLAKLNLILKKKIMHALLFIYETPVYLFFSSIAKGRAGGNHSGSSMFTCVMSFN